MIAANIAEGAAVKEDGRRITMWRSIVIGLRCVVARSTSLSAASGELPKSSSWPTAGAPTVT